MTLDTTTCTSGLHINLHLIVFYLPLLVPPLLVPTWWSSSLVQLHFWLQLMLRVQWRGLSRAGYLLLESQASTRSLWPFPLPQHSHPCWPPWSRKRITGLTVVVRTMTNVPTRHLCSPRSQAIPSFSSEATSVGAIPFPECLRPYRLLFRRHTIPGTGVFLPCMFKSR